MNLNCGFKQSFMPYLSSGEKGPKNLWNAGAVLHQLSYQANLELLVMWIDDKPVGVYIYIHLYLCDVNTWNSDIWTAEWNYFFSTILAVFSISYK